MVPHTAPAPSISLPILYVQLRSCPQSLSLQSCFGFSAHQLFKGTSVECLLLVSLLSSNLPSPGYFCYTNMMCNNCLLMRGGKNIKHPPWTSYNWPQDLGIDTAFCILFMQFLRTQRHRETKQLAQITWFGWVDGDMLNDEPSG